MPLPKSPIHGSRSRRSAPIAFCSAVLLLGALTACGGDNSSLTANTTATPASVSALSGDGQSAITGTALAQSLVAKVSTSNGNPVVGATVAFRVTSGSATLSPTSAVTDNTGAARTAVTMGSEAGTVVVEAAVQGTSLTTNFSVTSVATTPGGSCTPLAISVGAAITLSGTTVCLSGGTSGAEFVLVPFNSSTIAAARSTYSVLPTGITTVASTLAGSVFGTPGLNAAITGLARSGTAATGSTTSSVLSAGAQQSVDGQQAFELALRAREREALSPRMGEARAWLAARSATGGARLNIIPATASVGDLVSLNSNAIDACTKAVLRTGRVMAVGRKALVVADTLNPAGGFTQADYASIATTFDDVVDVVDTRAFGEPSDIDGNGHVILYFTGAVNALTPKNAGYYIGGFFYGRDLIPKIANSPVGACAASNAAEMFYLLVPDPNGTINGNVFSKSFVTGVTISTVAHEYQHLINASRRLYVNTAATDFEETWLDEGLAHTAEELLFYARSGLTAIRNIDATLLRSDNTYRNAFNTDAISNFGRLQSFLASPSTNSPYASNDSLATRGATWSFLSYAVDQQSGSQESVLYRIVNSTTTGLTNLRTVFGNDLTPLFRDWATAFVLDDIAGADTRFQFRSWNLASILGALREDGAYPLAAQALANGVSKSLSISGGGAAYLRFGVAAGGTGSLNLTAPAAVQSTVVRLK